MVVKGPYNPNAGTRTRTLRRIARVALALFSTSAAVLASEAGLRAYLHHKGVGRGDLSELLKQSERAEAGGKKLLHGGTGLFGLVRPSEHPDVVYELRPEQSGIFSDAPVATNSHGMRSPEVSLEKPSGTFRIAGIGDSHMFGWGIPQGSTYLELLEQKLNRSAPAGRRFEVLNFAAPGYNTAMEVALFEHKALRFRPDLVVIHFIGNDMQEPHFIESVRTWAPSDWYLVELGRALADREESEQQSMAATPRRYKSANLRNLRGQVPYTKAMDRLRELCAERSVPVVFLVLGRQGKHRAFVIPYAEQLGFHLVEAGPWFSEHLAAQGYEATMANWNKLFDGKDAHPSVAGHIAYSEALFDQISALLRDKAPAWLRSEAAPSSSGPSGT